MPWADAIFALDRPWWQMYWQEITETFKGELFTTTEGTDNVQWIPTEQLGSPCNSGAGAIAMADYFGAKRIILIGFDCHKRGGSHHHGSHPKGLGDAGSMPKWPAQFEAIANFIKAEVVNCSPGTALQVFQTGNLIDELKC